MENDSILKNEKLDFLPINLKHMVLLEPDLETKRLVLNNYYKANSFIWFKNFRPTSNLIYSKTVTKHDSK